MREVLPFNIVTILYVLYVLGLLLAILWPDPLKGLSDFSAQAPIRCVRGRAMRLLRRFGGAMTLLLSAVGIIG